MNICTLGVCPLHLGYVATDGEQVNTYRASATWKTNRRFERFKSVELRIILTLVCRPLLVYQESRHQGDLNLRGIFTKSRYTHLTSRKSTAKGCPSWATNKVTIHIRPVRNAGPLVKFHSNLHSTIASTAFGLECQAQIPQLLSIWRPKSPTYSQHDNGWQKTWCPIGWGSIDK